MSMSVPSKGHKKPASPARPRVSPPRAMRPAVDERLVMPETRFEIIDGKVEYVPPSDEPHGSCHSKIAALLEAHVVPDYDVAVDMLTRTSEKGDMAPDASVFPAERDPETGGRRLEELAFEVLSTERLAHAAKKARALVDRGVRKVFAVDVERRRVLAWSRETAGWEILSPDAAIEDPALVLPLPIAALVDAAKADDAVASALIAKKNPVIEGALSAAEARGQARGEVRGIHVGKVAALLAVLSARGVKVSKKAARQIQAEQDEATVDAWLARAASCVSVEELLGAARRPAG